MQLNIQYLDPMGMGYVSARYFFVAKTMSLICWHASYLAVRNLAPLEGGQFRFYIIDAILNRIRTAINPITTLLDLNLSCLFATPLHVPVVFFSLSRMLLASTRTTWKHVARFGRTLGWFIRDNTGCHPVKVLVSFKKMPWTCCFWFGAPFSREW